MKSGPQPIRFMQIRPANHRSSRSHVYLQTQGIGGCPIRMEPSCCYVCKQSRPCCRQPILELGRNGTHNKFVHSLGTAERSLGTRVHLCNLLRGHLWHVPQSGDLQLRACLPGKPIRRSPVTCQSRQIVSMMKKGAGH